MQNLDVKNSPLERGVPTKRTGCVTPLLRGVPASPLTKGDQYVIPLNKVNQYLIPLNKGGDRGLS
jgi:hypothetical protein